LGIIKIFRNIKNKNLPRMLSVQNPYNLLNRTYEVGLAEMSVREQSGLLAYSLLLVVIFLANIEIINYQKDLELHFIKISGLDIINLTQERQSKLIMK
jgi:hypothetical protein